MRIAGVVLIIAALLWWKFRRPLIAPLSDNRVSEQWLTENVYREGAMGKDAWQ